MFKNILNFFRYKWLITKDTDDFFSLYRRSFVGWDFQIGSFHKENLVKIIEVASFKEYYK